jgi:hypothetical protein
MYAAILSRHLTVEQAKGGFPKETKYSSPEEKTAEVLEPK